MVGDGPVDLVFLPGWISQVEHAWALPALRRFLERLSAFSRLILFDRRGTGLSERVVVAPTLEQDVSDTIAVLDAVGSERTGLLTYALGGPTGLLLAARHPERVGALIAYASVARTTQAPGYEWAVRALRPAPSPPKQRVAASQRRPASLAQRSLTRWRARCSQ